LTLQAVRRAITGEARIVLGVILLFFGGFSIIDSVDFTSVAVDIALVAV
jgi:hypothetical protein